MKKGCALQVEFASMHGCPLSMLKNDDDDEPDGEDDAGDGDSDDAAVPDVGSECINAATGCTLEMLLEPACNPECAVEACFWDNGACYASTMGPGAHLHGWATASATTSATPRSATGTTATASIARGLPHAAAAAVRDNCPASWLGDGECDPACNVQQCRYDNGDCAPDSCLIALSTPDMSVGPSAMGAELSMGGARSVDGAGPPDSPHPGAVWYDLSDFGLQSLSIPAGSVNVPDRGGGMVDLVRLSLALCSPCRPPLQSSTFRNARIKRMSSGVIKAAPRTRRLRCWRRRATASASSLASVLGKRWTSSSLTRACHSAACSSSSVEARRAMLTTSSTATAPTTRGSTSSARPPRPPWSALAGTDRGARGSSTCDSPVRVARPRRRPAVRRPRRAPRLPALLAGRWRVRPTLQQHGVWLGPWRLPAGNGRRPSGRQRWWHIGRALRGGDVGVWCQVIDHLSPRSRRRRRRRR